MAVIPNEIAGIEYWSWLLTLVGGTGVFLAGRQIWWAWWVGVSSECLWFVYSLSTRQYGFTVASLIYGALYLNNALKWTNDKSLRGKP